MMKSSRLIGLGLGLFGCIALLWIGFLFVRGTRNEEGIGTLAGLATVFLGVPGLLALICGTVRVLLEALSRRMSWQGQGAIYGASAV